MSKRVNLYIQDEILWENFTNLVGRGNVSKWIENMIKPLVDKSSLANSYKSMSKDKEREQEANDWVSGTFGDVGHDTW